VSAITDHESARLACLAQAAATEDLPFGPDVIAFRIGGKIFALLALSNQPPTMNLKCDPERAIALRAQHPAIAPGYHMNKRMWNTLTLDGTLPDALVHELIAHSYALIRSSLPRKQQAELSGA